MWTAKPAQSIWEQTEFRLLPNQHEELNYNQNPDQFNKTQKQTSPCIYEKSPCRYTEK